MAHEFETGMFVGEKAWHGLGNVISEAPSTAEGIKLAGLDWNVKSVPLFTAEGTRVQANANQRESDGRILGVVGTRYTPLQNSEAFSFFDPFLKAGLATLETAGSLRQGERVWVMARLAGDSMEITKNDTVEKFLLLSNGHDGKLAVRVGFSPVRVVCQNTLAMAHNSADSKLIRVCHSSKVNENLEKVREIMNVANAEFEATAEQMKFLASRKINRQDLEAYVKLSLDLNFETERSVLLNQRVLDRVVELFDVSPGAKEAGHTYWGAYNAVNYYINYEKGREQETRMDNLWFGQMKNVNEQAFEYAAEMASGGSV